MATLFDTNFSFASPSSTTSTPNSRSVSPCSTSPAYPPPRFSVTDLASHFATQNLRTPNAQMAYDACSAYANTDGDEEGWSVPASSSTDSASEAQAQRSYSPGRRAQRQHTTRLLCTAPHRGEIAALVARMVAAREQCAVSSTSSLSSPTAPALEDEGYGSENDEEMSGTSAESSRRTSVVIGVGRSRLDSRGGGACVRKNVRIRKSAKERR